MKKFLKITGLVLVALAIIFFSLGLVSPNVTYTSEILINKPLAETFRKYNDPGTLKQWIPEMKSFEIVEIKPGMVGTKLKMIIENDGQTMELNEEVIAFEENKLVGLSFDAGMMHKTDMVEFVQTEDGTLIRGNYTCTGSNLFYKSLFSLFKTQFKSIDEGYLKNFKAFVEK
ncbi:MAG TPA: hypothetical protein PKJ62_04680 [Bacteroidia bacterium]|nr:hypothetical protein [Bacteroidia bacterium]HNS12597.1 hypothetical protein [Bacteroidia bacterium]